VLYEVVRPLLLGGEVAAHRPWWWALFWDFTRRLLVKWEKIRGSWNKKNTEYVSK
jgi:hypothetical protein